MPTPPSVSASLLAAVLLCALMVERDAHFRTRERLAAADGVGRRLQTTAELARVKEELADAQRRIAQLEPHPNCVTLCDHECSRYDNCKGEAWVHLNLYKLLQKDSGPEGLLPNNNCFGRLDRRTTQSLKQLVRTHVGKLRETDAESIDAEKRMVPARLQVSDAVSAAFQTAAEEILHSKQSQQLGGRRPRRISYDAFKNAAKRGKSLREFVADLAAPVCQPRGLSFADLKLRMFNRTHFSFNAQNQHQDALLFLLDLLFQERALFNRQQWLGVNLQQDPFDAMVIQDLIFRLKPDLIVETGTHNGGGSLFLASMLSLVNPTGKVVTVDPWKRKFARSWATWEPATKALWEKHVVHFRNSSLDENVVSYVKAAAAVAKTVLVVLDSAHHESFVTKELEIYGPLVTVGSYVVVEDTKLDRMLGGDETSWYGPTRPAGRFLQAQQGQFSVDRSMEYMWYTQHVSGFLKRVR